MENLRGIWKKVAGQKQGLAKVAAYNFLLVADSGQISAGVPAQ
jgi:hypothetical protein